MSFELSVSIIERIFSRYFRAVEQILNALLKLYGVSLKLETISAASPIDERIAKIETARANLQDALGALDELTTEADKNKIELNKTLAELDAAKAAHANESLQLSEIRKIAQADVASFRKIAGISNPIKERFIGFFAGIIASLVASTIWFLVSEAIGK